MSLRHVRSDGERDQSDLDKDDGSDHERRTRLLVDDTVDGERDEEAILVT